MPIWSNSQNTVKSIAINTPPRSEFNTPYYKGIKIQLLRKRIMNYILSDCNSGGKIVTKSNIKLLVDENTQNILVKAVGGGKLCLNNIDANIIQSIISEEEADYTVEIEK